MPEPVPFRQRRAVRGSVAAVLLTGSAIACVVVAKDAKDAPPTPVVAIAPSTPSLQRPSARRPGTLVLPKPKLKKKRVVTTAAAPVTASAPVASTVSASPRTSTASSAPKKRTSIPADTEFGPG